MKHKKTTKRVSPRDVGYLHVLREREEKTIITDIEVSDDLAKVLETLGREAAANDSKFYKELGLAELIKASIIKK